MATHMVNIVYVILMLSCVGFVLTAQVAYATNESSYLVGYHIATDQYGGCNNTDDSTCPPSHGRQAVISCYKGVTLDRYFTGTSEKVTNSTACMDGYVNGFKHWCQQNAKDCVDIVTKCGNGGCAPSIYINENKTAIKEGSSGTPESQLLGTWNFINKSSGVSGTMTFSINLVGGEDWSDQNFNQTIGGKTINLSPYCHRGCSTGTWGYYKTLDIGYSIGNHLQNITVTSLSPNHIQLQYPVKGYEFNPIVIDLTRTVS